MAKTDALGCAVPSARRWQAMRRRIFSRRSPSAKVREDVAGYTLVII
ncbi:hypothetical protein ETAE_1856 [Edwardsiella piscicida]|uniref:Uncharacterized protein n=1 Tax=Edwardsiella piscicida TaxID=1263550 RepID=A0AAU8P3S7_EDWPI|nr:hypothetical protein ETAE_1856 [Edwardsiella tarda EIB202]